MQCLNRREALKIIVKGLAAVPLLSLLACDRESGLIKPDDSKLTGSVRLDYEFSPDDIEQSRNLLDRYLSLCMKGERLRNPRVFQDSIKCSNPGGWDSALILGSYSVGEAGRLGANDLIVVDAEYLGKVMGSSWLPYEPRTGASRRIRMRFPIKKRNSLVQIYDPFPPSCSKNAAIEHHQQLLSLSRIALGNSADPVRIRCMREYIGALEGLLTNLERIS